MKGRRPQPPRQPQWKCGDCGAMNESTSTRCWKCIYVPKDEPRPIPPGKAT